MLIAEFLAALAASVKVFVMGPDVKEVALVIEFQNLATNNATNLKFTSIVLLGISLNCFGLTEDQLQHEKMLVNLARLSCSSELIEGQDYKLEASADGGVEVKLFSSKVAGFHGSFNFTKNNWKGRQRVWRRNQAAENENFRNCVREEKKFLREAYRPPAATKLPSKSEKSDADIRAGNKKLVEGK